MCFKTLTYVGCQISVSASVLANANNVSLPRCLMMFILFPALPTPGVHIARKIDKLGMWSSDTAEVFFDDVRVPCKNIIGQEGMGFTYQMLQFQEERLWAVANGEWALLNLRHFPLALSHIHSSDVMCSALYQLLHIILCYRAVIGSSRLKHYSSVVRFRLYNLDS